MPPKPAIYAEGRRVERQAGELLASDLAAQDLRGGSFSIFRPMAGYLARPPAARLSLRLRAGSGGSGPKSPLPARRKRPGSVRMTSKPGYDPSERKPPWPGQGGD